MQINEFEEFFLENAKKLNIPVDCKEIKDFYKYMNMLKEWNKKINLTAIKEPRDIILKHFIDSLTILKHIKESDKVIDVGTGAGFPGIPLKLANKKIKLTLLDAVNKKVTFLNDVIEKLELNNVEAIHGRAEEYGKNEKFREKYDVCTSRAVAPLNILLEYTIPFVKENGICICMKGPNVEEEILNSKKALQELGGEIEKVEKLSLSGDENQRNIIIIRKTSKTPNKYPRKTGTSKKMPL